MVSRPFGPPWTDLTVEEQRPDRLAELRRQRAAFSEPPGLPALFHRGDLRGLVLPVDVTDLPGPTAQRKHDGASFLFAMERDWVHRADVLRPPIYGEKRRAVEDGEHVEVVLPAVETLPLRTDTQNARVLE